MKSRLPLILKRVKQVLELIIIVGAMYLLTTVVITLNQKPAKYIRLQVREATVQAGSALTYDFSFCRYMGPEVATNIVQNLAPLDSKGNLQRGATPITLGVNPNVSADKGCSNATNRKLSIPATTAAGCYKLHRIGQYYKVIGFKPSSEDIYSNKFCVTQPTVQNLQSQIDQLQQTLDAVQPDGREPVSSRTLTPEFPPQLPKSAGPAVPTTEPTAETATPPMANIFQQAIGVIRGLF